MTCIDRLRLLFYARYPVLCGILLIVAGPLARFSNASGLLANTLLLHGLWQVIALTVVCLTASKMFLVQTGVICANAPFRFRELARLRPRERPALAAAPKVLSIHWDWSPTKTVLWLVQGLSLPVTAVLYSVATGAAIEGFESNVDFATGAEGLAIGIALDLCLFLIVAFVDQWLLEASVIIPRLLPIRVVANLPVIQEPRIIDRWLARPLAGYGYTEPPSRRSPGPIYFRPGHWQQFVLLAFMVAAYLLLREVTDGSTARPGIFTLPTSFFAVFGLIFISVVLAGASFFLDYYRFPVLVVLVAAVWLEFKFSGRDHKFDVPVPRVADGPVQLLEVFGPHARQVPQDRTGERTLVVVTAPGGGIHAAAWTAEVLTGLHYRYGDNYAHSLFLISAVSGGSVGTMYYAANFGMLHDGRPVADLLQDRRLIVQRAAGSGLEAVGWGLIFRDLPGVFVKVAGDRGTTLDECWRNRLLIPGQKPVTDIRMADWRAPVAQGNLPAVVFNATEVESGRRVLFSPVASAPRPSLDDSPAAPFEFARTYSKPWNNHDISVVTAARLSASFPYVTPTATPDGLVEVGHMADGGYIDNEGILTALDWIDQLVQQYSGKKKAERPFDRVLLLRIRHDVPKDPLEDGDATQKERARDGFTFAAFGPLKAVLTVRGTSQVERGQVEVDFLSQPGGQPHRGIAIKPVYIDFKAYDGQESPLSWKLTPRQFERYETAWDLLVERNGLRDVDAWFEVKRE